MKLTLTLFAAALAATAGVAQAQAIDASSPPVKLAPQASLLSNARPATTGQSVMPTVKRAIAPKWSRVTASRGPDGKLVARCDIVPSPLAVAAGPKSKLGLNASIPSRK